MDIPIIDSIDLKSIDNLTSVSDRYYQHKYCLNIENVKEEVMQRVSFHSNRLCLLSLAPNHPAMSLDTTIIKINFDFDEDTNRMKKVTGKSKKGAQKLQPHSIICYVEIADKKYPIYGCLKGKLIEINEQLLENPNLLRTHPVSDGYIALILPDLKFYEKSKECMLTLDEFHEELEGKSLKLLPSA